MIFTAADVSLRHLGTVTASYPPKSIHTEAIQANSENIGMLALEFELELRYNDGGFPYFMFQAERGTEEDPEVPAMLRVYPGNWIVPLWGELHVYHDIQFKNTFALDTLPKRTPERFEAPMAPVHEQIPTFVPESEVTRVDNEIVSTKGHVPSPAPRIPGVFESLGKIKVTEDENGLNVEKA